MPIANPSSAGSSPPGYLRASSANTGSTRNKPNMRKAKMEASEALARSPTAHREAETAKAHRG